MFVALAALSLLYAGFQTWDDEHNKLLQSEQDIEPERGTIKNLRKDIADIRPTVTFDFEQREPWVLEPMTRPDGTTSVALGFNPTRRLEGAEPFLLSIRRLEGAAWSNPINQFVRVKLAWTEMERSFDVREITVRDYLILFIVNEDGKTASILRSQHYTELTRLDNLLPGLYRMKLAITAKNLSQAIQVVDFKWTGKVSDFTISLISSEKENDAP